MLTKTSLDLQHKGFARLFKSIIAPAAPAPADTIITNPKMWTRGMLKSNHVLTVLDDCWDKIISNPGADLALCEIIHAGVDHQADFMDGTLKTIAERIMGEAKDAMQAYHKADKKSLKRGQRPVDICRTYYRPLKLLADLGFPTSLMAEEMLLENTMPEAEILNPEWIDPYTGEIDKEGFEMAEIKIGRVSDTGKSDDTLDELGWTSEERDDYARAQEGFNSEDGLDEDIEDDMGDVREPLWMEMQKDLAPTDNLKALRKEGAGLMALCQQMVQDHRSLSDEAAQELFLASPEGKSLFEWIKEIGTRPDSAAQDVAVIFLSFQHERAFPEEYGDQVRVINPNAATLNQWLDIFGDEFLEQFSQVEYANTDVHYDASPAHRETTQDQVDEFAAETLKQLVELNAKGGSEVTQTPEFLQAYYQVMLEARQTSSTDRNGKWHDHAQEAGWAAWRQMRSTDGDLAFQMALKAGKTTKEAMRDFWSVVNGKAEIRRSENGAASLVSVTKRDRITKLFADGVMLASGRKVNWYIAKLKLKGDELEFSGDERERIKSALTKGKIGMDFAAML